MIPRLMDQWIAAVALGLMLSFGGAPHSATATAPWRPPIPQPLGYVTDQAGILDPEWKARIRSVCQDLERKTGVEMVVVTVKNLAPYRSANEYASTIYQRW